MTPNRTAAAALLTVVVLGGCTTRVEGPATAAVPGADGYGDPYYPRDGNGGYDVDSYALELRFDPETDVLAGTTTVVATATQALSAFNLDLLGFEVSAVTVDGEDAATAAARELAEEADVTAAQWHLLIDLHNSPGFSTESIRVYLARELSAVAEAERHTRTDEEADLEITRVDLDEAVAMVFRGEITNAAAVGGLLAAARARDEGWVTLRPADTPVL